jgi:hypothetical protein
MMTDLPKIISEMKQLAEQEPFRMSAYNPCANPKMSRIITLDGEKVEFIFTLDEYPMLPHHIWHLSVVGKVNPDHLQQVLSGFFPEGQLYEIPQEAIVKLGMKKEQIANQRQFCQIKS